MKGVTQGVMKPAVKGPVEAQEQLAPTDTVVQAEATVVWVEQA
jgi:hypothetical protein